MSSEFTSEAKDESQLHVRIDKITEDGVSSDEVHGVYVDWAPFYNRDVNKAEYNAPVKIAAEVAAMIGDLNVKILDVAAGTGLAGIELEKQGFKNIDALDACNNMLEEAKKTGAYTQYICAFLDHKRTEIKSDLYDVIVATGAFVPSHLNQTCFEELIRITKPGGHIIIGIAQRHFTRAPQYAKTVENRVNELHDLGLWRLMQKKIVSNYFDGDEIGYFYIIEKNN